MEFDLSLSFREAKGHEKTFRNLFIVAQVAVSFILSIALLYGCGLETVGRKIRSETSGEAIRQSEIHKKSAENCSRAAKELKERLEEKTDSAAFLVHIGETKPENITFLKCEKQGNALVITGETKKKEEISRWQNALKAKTENSVWRVGKTEEREGVTHFELVKE